MNFSLSPRTSLVLIFALFAGPLLAAWLMYSGAVDYTPATTRNLGTLVEPPVPIMWTTLDNANGQAVTDSQFASHWVVLVPVPKECNDSCRQQLTELRQVHRASGRNAPRIRLAILLNATTTLPQQDALVHWLNETYPNFQAVTDPEGQFTAPLQQAGSAGQYLIDPLGNIMMRYATGSDPNHLKKDLKRLLTWSKLDEQ